MDVAQLTRSLEGRYAVERELGAGGMATVYLARDLKHNRRVAVKVLREDIGAVLGVERFLSEIQVTANLQHPNLLPLFDSGEAGGQLFYVMPYVDGESLRARLDREKQLPIPEALRIATAVASALDYAHRRGVIHRDLKPDNVLLHEGQPLVADFGIALAVSNAGGARITQTGVSLGTPHYMSPEQATGDRVIDARTDIYSLGAMTYEMLVGDPPHTGSTAQAVISRMLTEPMPSIRAMRPNVPEHVEAAVHCALEKLPADRFATAHAFAEALAGNAESAVPTLPSGIARSRRPAPMRAQVQRYTLGAVGVAAVALLAVAVDRSMRPVTDANTPTRFTMRLGMPGLDPAEIAISRDGRRIAYVAPDTQGVLHVMVRDLSSTESAPVPGTAGAVSRPVFTPDGAWIAFRSQDRLYKVPLAGGPPVLLVDSVGAHVGLTWLRDGSVIFTAEDGLSRVRGNPLAHEPVTRRDTARREFAHWTPSVLPGERAIIYTATPRPSHAPASRRTTCGPAE